MFHRLALTISVVLLLAAAAQAQSPRTSKSRTPDSGNSLGHVNATPDMWFYDQIQRQHDDPHAAIRRKAEFETSQRQHRLAAREWFGVSNTRPMVNPTPTMGGYGPRWGSNTRDPQTWGGQSTTPIILLR
jgi:hypothetical protein